MDWTVEFADAALTDLLGIFNYLLTTQHRKFGYDLSAAEALATKRVLAIRRNVDRIAQAPYRGTRQSIGPRSLRHVTLDRAVYWFTLDETAQVLRVEAIFFGGQDHLQRMFARLDGEVPKDLP